jgi:triosephosphate isomerase
MTNKYMYFIANWKMFGDLRTLNSLKRVINFSKTNKKKNFKLIYCPPNTLIYPLSKKFKKTTIEVGAQNCHESDIYGAYTGHVNSKMIKDAGANYVILGHSENRANGEKDYLINKKIKTALKNELKVIFCIGETLKQRKNKQTHLTLITQIKEGLKGIKNYNNIIIAYEPVWAIGTGIVPKTELLKKIMKFVKSYFEKKTKLNMSTLKFLYGGSVKSNNIKTLSEINEIDGFLIGGASQESKKFIDIIKKTFN